jgi:hypothetical protein
MKFILILSILLFSISCMKTSSSSTSEVSGKQTYEFVSCKDYGKEFKEALSNTLKLQSDAFFKQPNNTTFEITTNRENCHILHERYSVALANERDDWSIEVKSTIDEKLPGCGGSVEGEKSAEMTRYNSKSTIINEVLNDNTKMTVDTNRDCHLTIESTKESLQVNIFVDGVNVKNLAYDFKDIAHPAEVALRLKNTEYKRKLSPIMLTQVEMGLMVKDCINKNGDICVSTGRTLEEWLTINR